MRELRRYAARRPEGKLSLQRMVIRAVGVVAVIDGAELRICGEEILRKQSTRAQSAAGDRLPGRLNRTDIRRVQKPRHRREIAVRYERPERCMTPQRFRSGDVSSDDPDARAEIESAQHLVEHIGVAARARGFKSADQTV